MYQGILNTIFILLFFTFPNLYILALSPTSISRNHKTKVAYYFPPDTALWSKSKTPFLESKPSFFNAFINNPDQFLEIRKIIEKVNNIVPKDELDVTRILTSQISESNQIDVKIVNHIFNYALTKHELQYESHNLSAINYYSSGIFPALILSEVVTLEDCIILMKIILNQYYYFAEKIGEYLPLKKMVIKGKWGTGKKLEQLFNNWKENEIKSPIHINQIKVPSFKIKVFNKNKKIEEKVVDEIIVNNISASDRIWIKDIKINIIFLIGTEEKLRAFYKYLTEKHSDLLEDASTKIKMDVQKDVAHLPEFFDNFKFSSLIDEIIFSPPKIPIIGHLGQILDKSNFSQQKVKDMLYDINNSMNSGKSFVNLIKIISDSKMSEEKMLKYADKYLNVLNQQLKIYPENNRTSLFFNFAMQKIIKSS